MPTIWRLRGFKPRHKFMLITALTVVPLALVTLAVFLSVYLPVFDSMDEVVDETVNEMIHVNRLETALLKAAMPPNDYLIHGDPTEKRNFEMLRARVYDAFNVVLDDFRGTAEERRIIEQAQDMWTLAEVMGTDLFVADPDDPQAHAKMERFDMLIDKAAARVERFSELATDEVHAHAHAARDLKNRGIMWTGAAFVVALMLGIGGSLVLTHERENLADTSERDPLTGLYNRRGLEQRLRDATEKSLVLEEPFFSLLMMDVDHFKAVNDTHGHHVGDEVLKNIAKIAREHLRDDDVFGRFGGDEFVLLMDNLKSETAERLAERIRTGIEQAHMAEAEDGTPVHVTVTGGYATFPTHADDIDALIEAADHALYDAKAAGRNKMFPYRGERKTGA